jgi:hypothetical protein
VSPGGRAACELLGSGQWARVRRFALGVSGLQFELTLDRIKLINHGFTVSYCLRLFFTSFLFFFFFFKKKRVRIRLTRFRPEPDYQNPNPIKPYFLVSCSCRVRGSCQKLPTLIYIYI